MTRALLRATLHAPAGRLALGLHAALALVLCFVPLFDVLGFERAFATGILTAFTSPMIAAALLGRARARGGGDLFHLTAGSLGLNLALLLPAIVAGSAIEQLSQPCDREAGLVFLLLAAGGGAVFGSVLGTGLGVLSARRRTQWLLGGIVLSLFLGAALLRAYREPQIFAFSHPFGFWPGSIYDEELAVSGAFWAFRGYTLLLSAAALFLLRGFTDGDRLELQLRRPRWESLSLAAVLAALALRVGLSGEALGFDLTRGSIEDALARRVVTERFEIFVDPSATKEQIAALELDHELRYQQLSRFFGVAPAGRIKSFVYRDVDQKAALMGARHTQVARPWAKEIHIHGFAHPHPVLKHELAHVFAAELNRGLLGVPATLGLIPNIGIVEGVAVAADWPGGELTIHGWARAMRALELAPDPRRTLDVFGFWSISSARAYTVAGSFVRWLVDTRGIDAFGALYAGGGFEEAYGESLDALVTAWEAFIDAEPLSEDDLLVAEHRFKQPGIFQKVCARVAANLADSGRRRLAGGDVDGAIRELEQLLAYAPENAGPLLAISEALAREGRLDEAQRYADRALALEGSGARAAAKAKEVLGSLAWRRGDLALARRTFEEILGLHLSSESDRLQLARLEALERSGEPADILKRYLLGELVPPLALVRVSRAAREAPEDGLLRYLAGRLLESVGAHPEGITELEAALSLGLPGGAIEREARLTLGRLLFHAGRWEDAERTFEAVAEGSSGRPALGLEARDWAERAAYARRSGGAAE